MRISNNFFDECTEYKGYDITIFGKNNNIPVIIRLSIDEFNDRKQLITWLDFLARTNQWVPYDLYKDIGNISEGQYRRIENVSSIDIQYVEYSLRTKKINIY